MKKYVYLPVVLAAILLSLTNCNIEKIEGSGRIIESEVVVDDFIDFQTNSDFVFQLVQDTVSKVVIKADDNIIPYINVSSIQSELSVNIPAKTRFKTDFEIKIWVYSPDFRTIDNNGDAIVLFDQLDVQNITILNREGGDVIGNGIYADDLTLSNMGRGFISLYGIDILDLTDVLNDRSGRIELKGVGGIGKFISAGGGNIYADLFELSSAEVKITSSGGLSVNVYWEGTMSVNFAGGSSGNVFSRTDPKFTDINGFGGGALIIGIPSDWEDTNPGYYSKKK